MDRFSPEHLVRLTGVVTPRAMARGLRGESGPRNRTTMIMDSDREAKLSQFCQDYVVAGMPGLRYCACHPGRCLSAFVALCQMPALKADPSDCPDGTVIRTE